MYYTQNHEYIFGYATLTTQTFNKEKGKVKNLYIFIKSRATAQLNFVVFNKNI